jgi:hypothetical protein
MPTAANRGSAGGRLVAVALLSGALVHELPIDGSKDSLLAFAKSRVSLGRLRHRHSRLASKLPARDRIEMTSKRIGREPQHPLQLADPLRLRHGLAGEPLRDRRLGDAQRGSQLSLGQAALGTSAPKRPREVLPLIGRPHVRVLSQVEGT